MREETLRIFGSPVPGSLKELAKAVDQAISDAVSKLPDVQEAKGELACVNGRLEAIKESILNETFLHPRNQGSHYYPGLGHGTSDCKYCKCWMGGYRSGGPEGVDPFGECPGNPKLRTAYELLKEKLDGESFKDRPIFDDLPELPCDIAEALEQFKLAIIRHRAMKWENVDQSVLIDVAKRLIAFSRLEI